MNRMGSTRWKRRGLLAAVLGMTLLGWAPSVEARIRSMTLDPPTPFPGVGSPYVLITGVAVGEIDPRNPLDAVIQDIRLAPRDPKKLVLYSTKIAIVTPVDLSTGNHTLLVSIVNRGSPSIYGVGDLFEFQQGFSVVHVGWQADLSPADNPFFFTMSAPVTHEKNGETITGVVRAEFTLSAPASTQNIIAGTSTNTPGYPTVSLDNRHDTMTMRVHQDDPKVLIPNADWAYADCSTVPFPGVPNPQKVCLRNGFDTNHIYELVYTARDPIVMGLGLAAIRDVGSFFRYEDKDDLGNPNPLAGAMKYALAYGFSQSASVLRSYLRLGFNEDEAHRQVFDGMQPERNGGGRNPINVRFSQPGRGGSQHTEAQYPSGESPNSYGDTFDLLTGIRGGLLDRCRRSSTCPKIVHTMSAYEYWEGTGAKLTTDSLGRFDLDIPDNVRIYQFASTQHGGFSPLAPLPTSTGICQFLPNTNSYSYHLRALLMALQQWVASDTPPPPSMYPRIDRQTLVPLVKFVFPPNPLLPNPEPQTIFHHRQLFDRGPHYDADDVSGIITVEPPNLLADYPTPRVPQVDTDGNDIDGIRTLTLQVPLGTYTGWNIRRAGFSEGDACDLTGSSLTGSYMPFAVTKVQRGATGDPRPSLEERYGTLANYTALATAAANSLVTQRLLLPSDAPAAIQSATNQAQQAGLK
jgi:hypothetical protein